MSELAARVDPFQTDLFHCESLRVHHQRFAQCDRALLRSNATSTDHDIILLYHAVVSKAAHRIDRFLGEIIICRAIFLSIRGHCALPNAIDLLVDLGTMMIAFLTGSSNGELHTTGMPGTDTGNLSKTFVRLSWQLFRVPTAGDTLEPLAFCHSDCVDHFILTEYGINRNLFLKVFPSPVDFIFDGAAVQLNLHDVCLLLAMLHQFHLGMGDDTDNGAVLLDLAEIGFDGSLAVVVLPLLGVSLKCLLLGSVPVLVESTLAILTQMLGKDRLELSWSTRGLNVPDDTSAISLAAAELLKANNL